jgi:hypothetical protein
VTKDKTVHAEIGLHFLSFSQAYKKAPRCWRWMRSFTQWAVWSCFRGRAAVGEREGPAGSAATQCCVLCDIEASNCQPVSPAPGGVGSEQGPPPDVRMSMHGCMERSATELICFCFVVAC